MAARDRPSPRPVTRAPARPRRQPIPSSATSPWAGDNRSPTQVRVAEGWPSVVPNGCGPQRRAGHRLRAPLPPGRRGRLRALLQAGWGQIPPPSAVEWVELVGCAGAAPITGPVRGTSAVPHGRRRRTHQRAAAPAMRRLGPAGGAGHMAARDRPSPRPVTCAPARPRRQPITSSATSPWAGDNRSPAQVRVAESQPSVVPNGCGPQRRARHRLRALPLSGRRGRLRALLQAGWGQIPPSSAAE